MKKYKMNKGFTLIEILIAGFVISVGVVASHIVIQQIFAYSFVASSDLTAAYLAKEGVEIVRNIRDSNWLQREDYDTGLVYSGSFNGCNPTGSIQRYCEADYSHNTTNLNSKTLTAIPSFFRLADGQVYNYSIGSNTKFQRKIEIKELISDSLQVIVTVLWQEKGQNRSLIVESVLYDWY